MAGLKIGHCSPSADCRPTRPEFGRRQRVRALGFTLVELLVVIGIIALLISILLPVLNKARQQAYRTKCLSNMRQLMIATTMYTSETNGHLPFCGWNANTDDTTSYGYNWLFAAKGFRQNVSWASTHPPVDGMETGILWKYLKTREVYFCPLAVSADRTPVACEWITSYLMNGAQNGYGMLGTAYVTPSTQNIPGLKLSRLKSTSELVIYFEALDTVTSGYVWNDGAGRPIEEVLANRHYKGANVVCLDGHAEWWSPETWDYWSTGAGSTTRGRLWWSPLSTNGR